MRKRTFRVLKDVTCVSTNKTHTNNGRRHNFLSFDSCKIHIYIHFMVLTVMINEGKKEAVGTKWKSILNRQSLNLHV